jgi:3'-phosphoadenosine 5'-phosphosulfate sulfotransferase (PAPS reductase)/FAD synthetase
VSRDNFILCSGGMHSVAMTHVIHDDLPGRTRPRVVYLDTTIGNPAQRVYVQALSDHYDWQLHTIRTESDFVDTTDEYDFYGPTNEAHESIFQKMKGRQIDGLTTIAEDPHFYWGTYKAESEKRKQLVVEEWEDDRGAVHHAPIWDKDEQWVREYLIEHQVPPNPHWDKPFCTDCCCGSKATREELIEMEAEGYTAMAGYLRNLESELGSDEKTGLWAWGSLDEDVLRRIEAEADAAQSTLAVWGCGDGCTAPSLQPDGGRNSRSVGPGIDQNRGGP